jgi:cytidylate kinase
MQPQNQLHIAIDGPVAAGKGDIASLLSKDLGFLYINTGAMYRMLALACINNHIDRKDEERVLETLKHISMELKPPSPSSDQTYQALLNGIDVTKRILEPDVAEESSDVGIHPSVRKHLVSIQKELARGKQVVMEGRDIGLRVLPQAQLKIYLTASLSERARRRYEQWKNKGINKTYEEVMEEIKDRDWQDMHRSADPLRKLPDAWELDSTGLTQQEVVEKIKAELKVRKLL